MYRLLCILCSATSLVWAQFLPQGSLYAGLRVGLGHKQNAFNIGGDVEYVFSGKDQLGPGILTFGLSFDYSSYSQNVSSGGETATKTTTVVPITLCAVYHFSPSMEDTPEIDPYILIGFAPRFQTASSELHTSGIVLSTQQNDVVLVGGLGLWYHITPDLAAHLRLAFGASFLTAGVMYRLPFQLGVR